MEEPAMLPKGRTLFSRASAILVALVLILQTTGLSRAAAQTTAVRVYGQLGNFTTGGANLPGVTANTLNNPLGMSIDSGGGLYVADSGNHRVLHFPAGSTTANV